MLIITGVVIYLILLGLLFTFQRSIMYFPEKVPGSLIERVDSVVSPQHYGLPMRDETITSADGTPLQIWVSPMPDTAPILVYYHGNAGHLGYRADKFASFIQAGFGVVALSYRGFGASEGSPTEAGIYADAQAALTYLHETLAVPYERIVLYGESLGTGVAVETATHFPVAGVVLEAPYLSVRQRAQELYPFFPVKWLIHDHYLSMDKITHINAPLLIFHGERDGVIPIRHGKALLHAAHDPKKGMFYEHFAHDNFDPAELAHQMHSWWKETRE